MTMTDTRRLIDAETGEELTAEQIANGQYENVTEEGSPERHYLRIHRPVAYIDFSDDSQHYVFCVDCAKNVAGAESLTGAGLRALSEAEGFHAIPCDACGVSLTVE